MKTVKITTLDIEGLRPYKTLRRYHEHIKEAIFVAEGEKVVRRLLSSGLEIISMLLTPQWYKELFQNGKQSFKKEDDTIIYIAEKPLIETIVGFNLHQGIMAVGKIPAGLSLQKMIEAINKPYLLVALDGLANAENVGIVVRNCVAFGADAIVVGETSSSPYLRRAVRNSMGTVFSIPIVHTANLIESLKFLKNSCSTEIIAAHPHGRTPIYETNFRGNVCIVIGSEGEGISKPVLEICDTDAAIPMSNGTDSLNVSNAIAVFLYEARKQRGIPEAVR